MRVRLPTTLALVCVALSEASSAQTLAFVADHEDGGFLFSDAPPGPWDYVMLASGGGKSIGLDPGAAHSGWRGLRAVDTSNLPFTAGTMAQVDVSFDGGFSDRYVRFWFRPGPTSGSGASSMAVLHVKESGFLSPWGLTIDGATLNVMISYWDSNTDYFELDLPFNFTPNAWHLVEGAVIGEGTPSAEVFVWIDGVEQYRDGGILQTGWYADQLLVGHCWSNDGTFQGTFDYDEVAITTIPTASKVALDGGSAPLAAGACAPVQVFLKSSMGPLAAPYQAEQLRVVVQSGTATLYTDATCSTTGLPVISSSATSAVFGVRASEGQLQLVADTDNLLGTSAVFNVTDGGASGPLSLVVGCGCSSAGPATLAMLMIATLFLRRARRGKVATQPAP